MHKYLPHLIELRRRLIQSLILFLIVFMPLFYFDNQLYQFIAYPLLQMLPTPVLIASEITTPFTVPMKLAFVSAIFVAAPYFLFQCWGFVAPGLYPLEKKALRPLLIASIFLFYLGISFSFLIICPIALKFFVQAAPPNIKIMADIRHYLEFMLSLLFAGGLAFQVPVITLALLQAKLVSAQFLSHLRPYIIVLAFILGMLLTPPDVLSQILLALPMWGLFELGLLFGKYLEKQHVTMGESPTN